MFKKISMWALAGVGVLLPTFAFAAADADVVSSSLAVSTAIKENLFAAINSSLALIIASGMLVLMITLVWKFTKRFISGK